MHRLYLVDTASVPQFETPGFFSILGVTVELPQCTGFTAVVACRAVDSHFRSTMSRLLLMTEVRVCPLVSCLVSYINFEFCHCDIAILLRLKAI